jgi:hypothetical protein
MQAGFLTASNNFKSVNSPSEVLERVDFETSEGGGLQGLG